LDLASVSNFYVIGDIYILPQGAVLADYCTLLDVAEMPYFEPSPIVTLSST
jgi:hypothetical protein